jgi:glycosyltransferase involved in cell wall biosynthesis
MTAFNREKFIAAAIESVLASTYSNFELIVVDDCSTDDTILILRNYEKIDSRIKLFINEKNLGQFANRNKAASYSKGEFLKYVDSDDIIYPDTLKKMVEAMQTFPDTALGFCLTHGECKFPLPYRIESEEAIRQHYFGGGLLFVGPSGLIVKRSAFVSVNGFEEFGMPSDNHFTLKITSKFPVVAMARDLFWWRLHEDQVFSRNNNNNDNILNNYLYSKDIVINYSPLTRNENKIILMNLRKIFISHITRIILRHGKIGTAFKLLWKLQKKVQ